MGLSLKSVLPVAGAAVGFLLGGPGGSAAAKAALGGGLGTLLSGGKPEDAIKNAVLSAAGGTGLQSLGMAGAGTKAGIELAKQQAVQEIAKQAAGEVAKGGLFGTGITAGDISVGSSLLGLIADRTQDEEQDSGIMSLESSPDYDGRPISNLFVDPVTGKTYDTVEELEDAVKSRQSDGIASLNEGGYIEGPGTGTSDDINAAIFQDGQRVQEARLSDGEFVIREKAVKGAGDGDRDLGAKRLHDLMDSLERRV